MIPLFRWVAAIGIAGAQAEAVESQGIVPDTSPSLTTGTEITQQDLVTLIGGGRLAGQNLFHSFDHFSLAQGGTARWISSSGQANAVLRIINRVTGGGISRIDGAIDTTAFPNADFYFLNPAGIVFGPGVEIDVPSSAYFSTASVLNFAGGISYSVAPAGESRFSMDSPVKFGFVAGSGNIELAGAQLATSLAGRVSLIASGELTAMNASVISGAVDLLAVGDRNVELAFTSGGEFERLPRTGMGRVLLDQSILRAEGTEGQSGSVFVAGSGVQVLGSGIMSLNGFDSGASSAGVTVEASELNVGDGSLIFVDGSSFSSGNAISITADSFSLGGASELRSTEGVISINLAPTGIFLLEGSDEQSLVSTTSGEIQISNPLALIFRGGSIEAPEDSVSITAGFIIDSRDTDDGLIGGGARETDANLIYYTASEEGREAATLDASSVLRSRCRVRGQGRRRNRFNVDVHGVYVREFETTGRESGEASVLPDSIVC